MMNYLASILLLCLVVPLGHACHTVSIPDTDELTVGPYWIDPELNRSDVSAGQQGTPFTLTLRVWNKTTIKEACQATATGVHTDAPITDGVGVMQGVQVDIWYANAPGHYSGFSSEGTTGQTWLRGYQVTNSSGYVTFYGPYPGWYTLRTIHIHIRIRVFNSGGSIVYDDTTQVFFDDTLSNSIYASNSVYNHGTRTVFNTNDDIYQSVMQMPVTGNPAQGYQAKFDLYYPFGTTATGGATNGGTTTTPTSGNGQGGFTIAPPTSRATSTPTTIAPTSTPTTPAPTPNTTSTTDVPPSLTATTPVPSVSSSSTGIVGNATSSSAVMSISMSPIVVAIAVGLIALLSLVVSW